MLYAARECARVILEEGLDAGFARHELASRALRSGLNAMGLELFGDQNNTMINVTGVHIPEACGDGEGVRSQMLHDFGIEIGTSFGHLAGVIWRIGTMGYVCRKSNVLRCVNALDAVLRRHGYDAPANAGVDAVLDAYTGAANG
jgi:(S)-ureidoglycine-glyoxylate aminotransferase